MTRILDAELIERLGLSDSEGLTLVHTYSPLSEGVAHGAGLRDFALLLASSAQLWQPVGDFAMRHADEPAFVAFYEEEIAEVLSGSEERSNGRVAFDTRGEPACVRTTSGALVVARHGTVERWERADPFAAVEEDPSPPAIPAFNGVQCAEAAGAEPWLRSAVAELAAQEASIPNAASAGLLARLWTPPGGPPLATEALPRERVRSWILAATAEQRAELEQHAVSRAWSTADRIRDLDSNPASGPAEVAAIIEQRDDLQSVLRVLRLAGRGDALAHALRGLDATAEERFASLANVLPALSEDPQEARWMAVAWQEPGAWWTGAV